MRSSTIITLLSAGLAIASPIVRRALVTEVVTDVVYVYVTETIPSSTDAVTTVITLEVIPTQASSDTNSTSSITTSTSTTIITTSTTPPPDTPTPIPTTEAPSPTTEAAALATSSTPSPSPVQAIANASPTDYVSAVLYHHNIHRANHSTDGATYDDNLANYAAQLAATCIFHHDLTIGNAGYGQNIYLNGSSDFNTAFTPNPMVQVAYAITGGWYNGEVNNFVYYNQASPGGSLDSWAHFTQVIWAGSNTVGCATHLCLPGTIYSNMGAFFTVCNYSPEGNILGEFETNVKTSLDYSTVEPEQ